MTDEPTGSELLLNNLDVLTEYISKVELRVTNLEKGLRDVRISIDANTYEIRELHKAIDEIAAHVDYSRYTHDIEVPPDEEDFHKN